MVQIVKTKGICSGDARIEGHRIKVRDILWYVDQGMNKAEIAEGLNLTEEEVESALQYYESHQSEIEAEIHKAESREIEALQRYPSKLDRLRTTQA